MNQAITHHDYQHAVEGLKRRGVDAPDVPRPIHGVGAMVLSTVHGDSDPRETHFELAVSIPVQGEGSLTITRYDETLMVLPLVRGLVDQLIQRMEPVLVIPRVA